MAEVACFGPMEEEHTMLFCLIDILMKDFPELLREVLKTSIHHTQVVDLLKGLRIRVNKSIWLYSAEKQLAELDLTTLIQILNLLPEFKTLHYSFELLRRSRNELFHLPTNRIRREIFELMFDEFCSIADDIEDHLRWPRHLSSKLLDVRNKWRLNPCVQVNPFVPSTVAREIGNELREIQQEDEASPPTISTEFREKEVELNKIQYKAVPASQYMVSTELREIETTLNEIQAKGNGHTNNKADLVHASKRLDKIEAFMPKELRNRIKMIGKTLEKEDHNFFDSVHENSISTRRNAETKLDIEKTSLQYTRLFQEMGSKKPNSSSKVLSPRNDQSSSTDKSVNPGNPVEDKENNGYISQISTIDLLPSWENGVCTTNIHLSSSISVVAQASSLHTIEEQAVVIRKHQNIPLTNILVPPIKVLSISQSVMSLTVLKENEKPHSTEVSVQQKGGGGRLLYRQDLLHVEKTIPSGSVAKSMRSHIPLSGRSTKNKNKHMRLLIRPLSDGDSADSLFSPKHLSTSSLERLLRAKTNIKRSRKKYRCTWYEALGIELRTPISPGKCKYKGLEPCGDVGILHSDANEDRESAMKLQHQLMVIRPDYQIETQETIILPGHGMFNIDEILNYRRILLLVTPFYQTEYANVLRHRVEMILQKEPQKIVAVYTEDTMIPNKLGPLHRIKLFETLKYCRPNDFKLSSNLKESLGRVMDNVK